MKKAALASSLALLLLLAACAPAEAEDPVRDTDLDLTQYESVVLDIGVLEAERFTGTQVVPGPYAYTVDYALGEDFCAGDRVEVWYSEKTVDDEAGTARLEAVFVDASSFELDPNMCYKPVIYLYPEEETLVSVQLDFDGELTETWPEYGGGWTVTARPDGTLTDGEGNTYPYLFWEGVSETRYDMSRGFCVAGADTGDFLAEKLALLGLNEAESAEFLDFWAPLFEENAFNLIAFQGRSYSEGARLAVTPAPDSLLRVFMAFTPLDAPVEAEEQVLAPFTRTGFAVVEWGGAMVPAD